jgi:hypothetical protein
MRGAPLDLAALVALVRMLHDSLVSLLRFNAPAK